jgi:hypothetical protein
MIYDDDDDDNDDNECGAVCGMRIGGGNLSTWRKPAQMTLFPPQIPHDLTCARTQAAAVGSTASDDTNYCALESMFGDSS